MKPMKISVYLAAVVLLLCLTGSVHALSFDESFTVDFSGDPTLLKLADDKFEFIGSLSDPDGSFPADWKIAVAFDGSEIIKAEVVAGTLEKKNEKLKITGDDKIEGSLTDFWLTAADDITGQQSFSGILEQSGLTEGTLNPHNPWKITGYFTKDESGILKFINGSITNIVKDQTDDSTAPVPEPATMLLMGAGMLGMAAMRRRIKK